MKIYIASSWRNEHGVHMLTTQLRSFGHEVYSWVEQRFEELRTEPYTDFDKWVETEQANACFYADIEHATNCDLFIYYAPAGSDAAAEMGAAWAKGIPIIALCAKGDQLGICRKMWVGAYSRWDEIVDACNQYAVANRAHGGQVCDATMPNSSNAA